VEVDVFQGVGVPPALFGRLWEWRETAGRAAIRLALQAAQRLAAEPLVSRFPDAIPGWGGEHDGADPVEPSLLLGGDPLSELVDAALSARTGDQAARETLAEFSQGEGPRARFATALLPVSGDESLIPGLLRRYQEAQGRMLWAVEAALWGFRTLPGFWTPTAGSMLIQGGSRGWPVVGFQGPEEVELVYRHEARRFFAWVPGAGVDLVLEGPDGQRAALTLSAKEGVQWAEEEPRER